MRKPTARHPKLVILTTLLRADLHNSLCYFRRFEVWHFYHRHTDDISLKELGPRAIRFRGLLDLLIKIISLKPALIQGGEPYDFPAQLTLIITTLFASKILRVPYYFPTLENIPPEEKFAEIKRWGISLSRFVIPFVKWLARIYSLGALVIFAENKGSEENIRRLGIPENKISRLLYGTWGVDIDIFSPMPAGDRIDMGKNRILFVGRLIEMKGLFVLLNAFLEVKKQIPDVQLFIIGDGPLKEEIRQRTTSAGISSSVHLLGTVLNQHLPPYFRSASVTVSPSITTRRWAEQVGMANIQSMACGTPVISTRSGAIPEYVPDGQVGLLVPENNSTALATAIIRLLNDRNLHQKLSRNARTYAVEHYNARRNVAKVEALLWEYLASVET